MTKAGREALLELSAAERLELIEELWDSLDEDHEALALTDEQREDLDRRLAEADGDPTGGSPGRRRASASGIASGDASASRSPPSRARRR